jgi:hypothetical protein
MVWGMDTPIKIDHRDWQEGVTTIRLESDQTIPISVLTTTGVTEREEWHFVSSDGRTATYRRPL